MGTDKAQTSAERSAVEFLLLLVTLAVSMVAITLVLWALSVPFVAVWYALQWFFGDVLGLSSRPRPAAKVSRRERKRRQVQEQREHVRVLREIERDEWHNLQARWARKREELATNCDQCGRPAVEAKKYSWYQCGHVAILFVCEQCALPYQMPCPTCAEQKRIALEQRWRWLLKAAAYFHVRQRFIK